MHNKGNIYRYLKLLIILIKNIKTLIVLDLFFDKGTHIW